MRLANWRTSTWAACGLLGLLGLGVYFLLATQYQQDLGYDLYGLGAVVAILVGVHIQFSPPAARPGTLSRSAWPFRPPAT
jgi:prepilin signal peptidase PulO-like enzyme (type II secretory pathway)